MTFMTQSWKSHSVISVVFCEMRKSAPSVWKKATQGHEYQGAGIIVSHLRGWLPQAITGKGFRREVGHQWRIPAHSDFIQMESVLNRMALKQNKKLSSCDMFPNTERNSRGTILSEIRERIATLHGL